MLWWAEGVTEKNLEQWIAQMETKYGKTLNVAPLPEEVYQDIDPITEIEWIKNTDIH